MKNSLNLQNKSFPALLFPCFEGLVGKLRQLVKKQAKRLWLSFLIISCILFSMGVKRSPRGEDHLDAVYRQKNRQVEILYLLV